MFAQAGATGLIREHRPFHTLRPPEVQYFRRISFNVFDKTVSQACCGTIQETDPDAPSDGRQGEEDHQRPEDLLALHRLRHTGL